MAALYGVIGDPISHSLSPLIHRGWMRDLGVDGDYRAFLVPGGELADGLAALERDGVRGLNVTLPHKVEVAGMCETVSPLAGRLGAVNTLSRLPSGGWGGDNTDYQGFLDDFRDVSGFSEPGRVLLLGAGGAAKAVALALSDLGFEIVLANRTVERAHHLSEGLGLQVAAIHGLEDVTGLAGSCDAVVNTLSVGHSGQSLSLGDGDGRLFYDISYGMAAKANLDAASDRGWKVADGLGMLVGQAARSFEIWHGQEPDRSAALTRCLEALGLLA